MKEKSLSAEIALLFDQLDPDVLRRKIQGNRNRRNLLSQWKQKLEACRQALEDSSSQTETETRFTFFDDDDDSSTISIVVVESLARSRFLTTVDLGKFLLLTSRSITKAFPKDTIYKYLCWNELQATYEIPKSIMQLPNAYQFLFQNLVVDPEMRRRQQQKEEEKEHVESTSYLATLASKGDSASTNEEYVLLISIRDDDRNAEIFSKSLSGGLLERFLTKGELNLHLTEAISVPNSFRTNPPNWSSTIYIWSPKALSWFSVHESRVCNYGEFEYCHDETIEVPQEILATTPRLPIILREPTVAAAPSPPEEGVIDQGYLEFVSSSYLSLSEPGEVLLALLQERRRNHLHDKSNTIEGIKFEPTLLCCSIDTDKYVMAQELRLDIWIVLGNGAAVLFDTPYHFKKYGIGLLPFLELLEKG